MNKIKGKKQKWKKLIYDNSQWIFSGIGVFILTVLLTRCAKPNQNTPSSNKIQSQKSSNSSINLNVGDSQGNVNVSITPYDLSTTNTPKYIKDNFQITDIIVEKISQNTLSLDFRVMNNSNRTVNISRLKLKTLAFNAYEIIAKEQIYTPSSYTYKISLNKLNQKGALLIHPIAHTIKANEADRFKFILGFKNQQNINNNINNIDSMIIQKIGTKYKWRIKPSLITSEGEITATQIEFGLSIYNH